jgi:hypothetical protein
VTLARLRTATGSGLVRLYVQDSGKLAYRNDVTVTTSTAATKPSLGAWHTVELHAAIGGGGQVEVWLDGARLMSKSESLGATPIGRLQLGDDATGRVFDVVHDDVVLDTAPLEP